MVPPTPPGGSGKQNDPYSTSATLQKCRAAGELYCPSHLQKLYSFLHRLQTNSDFEARAENNLCLGAPKYLLTFQRASIVRTLYVAGCFGFITQRRLFSALILRMRAVKCVVETDPYINSK